MKERVAICIEQPVSRYTSTRQYTRNMGRFTVMKAYRYIEHKEDKCWAVNDDNGEEWMFSLYDRWFRRLT